MPRQSLSGVFFMCLCVRGVREIQGQSVIIAIYLCIGYSVFEAYVCDFVHAKHGRN